MQENLYGELEIGPTMKENDKIVIPILHIHGWSDDTPDCGCDTPCGCSVGCNPNPQDPTDCCFGQPPPCLCEYHIPSYDQGENWELERGLVAPGLVIDNNNVPFKVQIKKSQTFTKSVYITPGICVDMLCPDCNSYESC